VGKTESNAFLGIPIDHEQLSLIGSSQQVSPSDAAECTQTLEGFYIVLVLDLPRFLSVIIQLSKLSTRHLLACVCLSLWAWRQFSLGYLGIGRRRKRVVPLAEALLDGFVVEEVGEGGSFALVVLQHLFQQGSDLSGTLIETETMADDLLTGKSKAIYVIFEGIGAGVKAVIALLVKPLQSRRAVSRGACEPPRPLKRLTAESEISQFES
jgi:hypothetical protein